MMWIRTHNLGAIGLPEVLAVSWLSRLARVAVLAVVVMLILAVGCGSTEPEPTSLEPSETTMPTYQVERADEYVGTRVPHPATDYERDGFKHFGTFVGTSHGGIFTYRRGTGPDLEFLALLIQHDENEQVSDALRLTTNGEKVSLGASCSAKGVMLSPGTDYRGDRISEALRVWSVDENGQFIDSGSASASGC